jgi:proteasome accessory factor B
MGSKRTTVNATERMLNLVALLTESSVPLTLEDISHKMAGQYPEADEARRTSFERDKRSLRALGLPITTQTLSGSDAGKTAYSINRAEYALIDFGLTETELDALQQAAALVQIGTTWGKQAVQWLGGEITSPEMATAVKVDAQSRVLPVLWEAVGSFSSTAFAYRSRQRVVHPYGLLARNGFWYLIGFDTARDMQVTFRVDRIEGDISVGEPNAFERPPNFNVLTAFTRDPKEFADGPQEVAVVRLDHRVAPAAVRELGGDAIVARRSDGSIDVEVACGNRTAFKSWLYAMVDRAEVVSPEHIRQEIIADLQKMAGGAA